MCGIFGFWSAGGTDVRFDGALLRAGTDRLAHRGPDGEGRIGWTRLHECPDPDPERGRPLVLGLGHRRLSILDLSEAGRQPMQGPGGVWISYNGEIYNYRELRRELKSHGFTFCTGTDTEVILAAYAAWGERCVERFNGMWAFLLFDPARRRLVASRDRLGVKPLYYARTATGLAFASEIPPLLACPGVTAEIVPQRMAAYLVDRRIDDEDGTLYRHIRELRAAHTLVLNLDAGTPTIYRYWQLPDAPDLELSDEDALDTFAELIEDAVRLRLHADVPVAITLSGGVDSSVLTVAASRVAREPVLTFTSRFPGQGRIDESAYAAEVARECGAVAHFVEPLTDRVVEEEPRLSRHQALPYGSLSLYVHWAILACIRDRGVPVVLSGQGGDEAFLGYERFYGTAALASLPHLGRAAKVLWQGSRHSGLNLAGMLANVGYFAMPQVQRWLRSRWFRKLVRPIWLDVGQPAEMEVVGDRRRQQALELTSVSLPALLRYDDRTAGAHGMETRLPFLDYRLIEFAYRLPLHHKIRDGWTKYLLRQYLARHALPSIAWRKEKVGFAAPQAAWSRALVAARGAQLVASSFARDFLVDGVRLDRLPTRAAWDVYNCLHLAQLFKWSPPSSGSSASHRSRAPANGFLAGSTGAA